MGVSVVRCGLLTFRLADSENGQRSHQLHVTVIVLVAAVGGDRLEGGVAVHHEVLLAIIGLYGIGI